MDNFEKIVDSISLPAFSIDINHKVTFWNNACEKLTGVKKEDIIGKSEHWKAFYKYERPLLADLVLNNSKSSLKKYYDINDSNENNFYKAESWLLVNSEIKFLVFEAKPIISKGVNVGAIQILSDLTEYKMLSTEISLPKELFNDVNNPVLISNSNYEIIFMNNALEKISGYSLNECIGKSPKIFNSSKNPNSLFNDINLSLRLSNSWKGQLWNKSKSGKNYLMSGYINKIKKDGESSYITILKNITNKNKKEKEINFLANYDYLTKLPNRVFIENKIKDIIKNKKQNKKLAVMFLDLDKFKHINDSLGHDIGDGLLKEVSKKLKKIIKKTDCIARQGGDEFVILLEDFKEYSNVDLITKRIKSEFEKGFLVKNNKISIGTSIGVAFYPQHGKTYNDLLKNADMAMYWAKSNGVGEFFTYKEEIGNSVLENITIVDKLSDAIDKDIKVYFQPQYSTATRDIYGAEALVRWKDKNLDWISPGKFIPLAEEFGLIKRITNLVLRESCRIIKETNLIISVNISSTQLKDNELYEIVDLYLKEYEIEPKLLTLEITETSFVKNFVKAKEILDKIKTLGVNLALDDFGTGYSSLAYLNQLPFDYLKIDQSFIKDKKNMSIVLSIIDMADKLNLYTVAEGVETEEDSMMLNYSGCSIIQGYYYSRPLDVDSFMLFIKEKDTFSKNCLGTNINKESEIMVSIQEIQKLIENKKTENIYEQFIILYNKLLNYLIYKENIGLLNKEHNNIFLQKYMLYMTNLLQQKTTSLIFLNFIKRWTITHLDKIEIVS